MDLFLDLELYLIDLYMSILTLLPHCLYHCSFLVVLEITWYKSSNFVLFQNCCGHYGFFTFSHHKIIKLACQFLKKRRPLEFWFGLHQIYTSIWGDANWRDPKMLNFPIDEHIIFLHLFHSIIFVRIWIIFWLRLRSRRYLRDQWLQSPHFCM